MGKKREKSGEEVLEEKRRTFKLLREKLSKEAKEKVEKLEADVKRTNGEDARLVTELETAREEAGSVEVLFVGLDCGKSGLNAVVAPGNIRMAVMRKAQAEAVLAQAEESGVAKEEEIAAAKASLEKATLSEEEARRLFESAQVPSASSSRSAVDGAPRLVRKNCSEKGAHPVTKGLKESELLEKKHQKQREDQLAIVDACFVKKGAHGAMLKEFVGLNSVAFNPVAELAAIQSRFSGYRFLQIAYNSGVQRKQRRTTAIKRRGFVARCTRLLTKLLPEAVLRAPPDKFLARSLPFPQRSPQSRQRDMIRGWERGVKRAMDAMGRSVSTCRLPIWISVDMFSGKGQRTSSTFPFQELYRSVVRHINSRPELAARVTVQIDNGYRSSRQAAGTMCYLANMAQENHRKVRALDLPDDWLGPIQDGFGYFFCPLTKAILKRDPPAALSMSTIGACTFYNAPHPAIWAPAQSSTE